MGNTSAVKWIGVIGEYRIDWGPGYRVYLAKDGEDIVILLGGGTKRRQQADIEVRRRFGQNIGRGRPHLRERNEKGKQNDFD